MGSSDAEEDSGEDSGEESGEEGSQSAAASEPNPRSLVLDAGARMEMLLHRLRSAHLDALTRVAYGMSLPATRGSGGAAAAPLLPLPALPGSSGPRSAGHAEAGFRTSLPKHNRGSAADMDKRLAEAARGAALSPRTREAVVAAAIDRLLSDD
ncbi:hypothetical protein FNF28_06577 [Cafeteria roenbergensis]|uniref:Uncharacterized protein n=1 Tax=Cafeteria roenbergensis TaxID=33653 RepID=A0A5A8CW65_CAFRO|nr:hypothetical protein FNF28_06577 [Cafeteria roenbergensis]